MIALFGHGTTTKAIAKRGGCQIFDDSFTEVSQDQYGNTLLPPNLFDPKGSILQIPSPSFPLDHPLMQKAENIISEYDFFAKEMPFSVWISGTNGKTTTTQMLQHLLAHRASQMGGNIGTPLALLDTKAPMWILETSSYMLHLTKIATPGIYLLLPIKPDHLKYHGSFGAYEQSKLSPLDRMDEGSIAVIPSKYASYPSMAHKICYENEADLAKKIDIAMDKINFQTPFLLDALLAMSADKILFDTLDYAKINSFKTDEHKLEELKDSHNRLWVNDSKGTNVDATLEALRRYKSNKILIILGGDDKGVDLNPLFEAMSSLHVKIFTIGSTAELLSEMAEEYGIANLTCKTLDIAVDSMQKEHNQNSVALLSPATSSFDQFDSFVHRGLHFKNLIAKI